MNWIPVRITPKDRKILVKYTMEGDREKEEHVDIVKYCHIEKTFIVYSAYGDEYRLREKDILAWMEIPNFEKGYEDE